jgi:hypothetical protein
MATVGSVLTDVANQVFGFNSADVLRPWEFQRDYMWDVRLPELGASTNIFGIPIGASTLVDVGRFCQSIDFGDYDMQSLNTMQAGAYTNKFASMLSIKDIDMTFLRPSPDVVTPYFQKWRSLAVKNSVFYPKKNYAKTIYIYMLGVDNMIAGTFKCVGCFPTQMPSYKLDYKGDNVLTFPIKFSVDRIEAF